MTANLRGLIFWLSNPRERPGASTPNSYKKIILQGIAFVKRTVAVSLGDLEKMPVLLYDKKTGRIVEERGP
jgi:hypothetical protein